MESKAPRAARLSNVRKALLALALAALFGSLSVLPGVARLFAGVEERALDYWFLLRGARDTAHLPILVVLIDDETLVPFGFRSPTPRLLLAQLIREIDRKGARCIGMDYVLDRPSREPEDQALQEALEDARAPVVLVDPALPRFARLAQVGRSQVEGTARETTRWYRLNAPEPAQTPSFVIALAKACGDMGVGHVTAPPERALINYYGPPSDLSDPSPTFTVLRAGEIASVPDALTRGRIVLVGSGVRDLGDIFLTPFSTGALNFRESFGVELHATVLGSLIEGEWIEPAGAPVLGFLTGALYGLAALAALLLPLRWAILAGALALVLWPLSSAAAFVTAGIALPAIYPVLFAGLVVFLCEVTLHFTEARQARFLHRTFSRYLSSDVVEEMSSRGWGLDLGGESRVVTIFFSDLEGFTALSERMKPAQVVHLLNRYLGAMTDILFEERGTIGDFIGDAIMAYFGAPVPLNDHAARALRSAVRMQRRLDELNAQWTAEGLPALRMRIGIHTGEVILGNIGSERRTDFTIIGDAVNLSARLEGANKAFGTSIMVSGEALERAGAGFHTRELARIVVKGKTKPVAVHELLGFDGMVARKPDTALLNGYAEALGAFYAGRWKDAESGFRNLFDRFGDQAAGFMSEQCQALKTDPPEGVWNGAVELRSK